MTDELKITGLPDSWKKPPEDSPTLTNFNSIISEDTPKFELINTNRPKILLKVPSLGDMNYLFLSLYQARYLLDELKKTIKAVNKQAFNDDDTLVIPFPKEETNNE